MLILPKDYRIVCYNETGQTIAANSIFVYGIKWKLDSSLNPVYSAEVTFLSSGSTLATATYLTGSNVDNDTDDYWGITSGLIVVTAPASSNGDVTFWIQPSPDDGTDYPDNGLGHRIGQLNFTTSGTKRDSWYWPTG